MTFKWREVLWCLMLLEFHIFHPCDSTATTSKVSEKSLKVSKEVVREAGVEHTDVFLLRLVYVHCTRIEHLPEFIL